MKLYSYWRSTAAYRVRIALNLKSLSYETIPVNLRLAEHGQEDYLLNDLGQGVTPLAGNEATAPGVGAIRKGPGHVPPHDG